MLNYFRGIDEEDLLNDSRIIYPIHSALGYANNLDGVLRQCSSYRGIKKIHRILRAKTLTVSEPDKHKTKVLVSSNDFKPVFKQIFSSDVYMSARFPITKRNTKYTLIFSEDDNSEILMYFGKDRMYYGKREYYQLQTMGPQLTEWLDEVLS